MPLPVMSHARTAVERSLEASAVDIETYAGAVIEYAESAKEKTRRAEIQLRLNIYRDAWWSALESLLKQSTHPTVFAAVNKGKACDMSRNPAKRIWSELAVLYTAPARRWTDPEEDGDRYNEIQAKALYTPFGTFWPDVEELVQVCNDVLIWPEVVNLPNGDKLPVNRYCCGNAFTLVWSTSVPGMIECVCELDDRVDPRGTVDRVYHIWTDEWYASFRMENGKPERVDIVQEAGPSNPYQRLPHWLIRRRTWQDVDLDSKSGDDLVRGTLSGGVAQQFYRYHQKMSGFKQVAVSGLDIEEMPKQLLDPGAVFKVIGHGASMQIIDWQLALKDAQDVMDTDELRLAASRGVNPERYKRTANYQTTLGAAMSERPLEYLRSRMVPPFDIAEEQFYRSCCRVWAQHGLDNTPDEEAKFHVEHVPLRAPEDPEGQLDVEAKELALLLVDHIGLLKRRRPELTDAEARAELERIAGNIKEVQALKSNSNIPNDPENESSRAEDNGAIGPVVRDGTGNPPGSQPGQPLPDSGE